MAHDHSETPHEDGSAGREQAGAQDLVVAQTATGYWFVQRGGVALAGAMTRRAAEAERDMLVRLARRSVRRAMARA